MYREGEHVKGASEIQGILSLNGVRRAESTLEKCGGCGLYENSDAEEKASTKEMLRKGYDCGDVYDGVIATRWWRDCSGVVRKK